MENNNNTNNHITLLAKLGIDTSNKQEIQQQIDDFAKKLQGLNVNINISPQAIKALEGLANIDFSKMVDKAKKATDGVKDEVLKTKDEIDKILKKADENVKIDGLFSKHALTDIENVKKALLNLNPNVKVDFAVDENGLKDLKKIKASYEKDGITTHINFKKQGMSGSDGEKINEIWIPSQIQEVHKELTTAAKNTEEFRKKIRSLTLDGKITVDQFKELYRTLKTTDVNSFGKLNSDLAEMVIRNRNAAQAIKDQQKALRDQELEQKRLIENDIKRRNLIFEIERAMRAQTRTFDASAGKSLIDGLIHMDVAAKDFNTTLKMSQSHLNALKANATEATRSNIGLIDSFKIAMTKFPIWMAATTIFYSSIRTAREFMNIIVDIDTKMTSLAKVMSADTDFDKLFDSAIDSAERFGQSLSQVLDAYGEFARQGFKGDELKALSDVGLVASNVGEITSQKAAEYMTATLIQWQMEVKEGSKIIDSWNEISNNYSTTLEKLAQGHTRAAASAKAMNLDFNQTNAIIGSLTAATKQSGNEIGNFLKNVLPRLVGQPGQDALATVGVSLSDENGNIRDVIEVYTEVAQRVQNLTEVERIAITEGLAGKNHLTRMQVLLNDLGSANSMYRQMYDTSVNSAGSANEENERYMNSLQARINLARVEVEKLAITMGEAFLTEGMIQSLQVFNTLMGWLSKVAGTVGALPIILATVGVAVTLLSNNFKGLIGNMALTTSAFVSTGVAGTAFGRTLTLVTAKVAGLSASMKTLLASTGVGAALLVLGFGFERLLSSMTKSREAQESLTSENKELADSYLTNKDTIKELSDEYAELSEAMSVENPSLQTQEKYYQVQNQLAELMPSLISYEDSYGNSILQSSGIVSSKIKLLEDQIAAEERLQNIQKEKEAKEKLELSQDNVKSYNTLAESELGGFKAAANRWGLAKGDYVYKEEIKNLQDMEKAVAHYEEMRVMYAEQGEEKLANKMTRIADDLRERMSIYQNYTTNADIASNYLAQRAIEDAETVLNSHKKMSSESKELAKNLLSDMVLATENSGDVQIFADMFKSDDLQKELEVASKAIEAFKKSSDETFESNQASVLAYGDTIKEVLTSSLKDAGVDASGIDSATKSFDDYISKLIITEQATRDYAEANNISLEQARLRLFANEDIGESYSVLNEELAKYLEKVTELTTAEEMVAGVSAKLVSETNSLIFAYQNLTDAAVRTAEQEAQLTAVKEKLALLYPHLVENGELRIESILAESKAHDILLKALEASKKDMLTAEEEATLKQFIETNSRIKLINQNIAAINKLIEAYELLSNKAQRNFDNALKGGNSSEIDSAAKELMRYSSQSESNKTQYQAQLAELVTIEGTRTSQAGQLVTALDRVEKSQEKAAKTTKDKTNESIYITDKYKMALERVNAEIEKQQLLRSDMNDTSQEYRDSLQAEIKLEQEKKKLMEDQAASLRKQISTGKIKQTGTITSNSKTTSKDLNGWDGTITSRYGMRTHPITGVRRMHEGTDIDGKRGDRIDANVGGKVIASGNSKQTGYASSYGNIVVVQDSEGVKHIYAHLDKAIAKLGDTIVAGMQIGTIGETGLAKGSHLHYETRTASGKAFDSANYVSNAKSGKITSTSSTSPSTVTSKQEAIDQAKSDLIALENGIVQADKRISGLELESVTSQLNTFNEKRDTYQRILSYEDEKIKTLDTSSERYGATLDRNRKYMEKTQDVNRAQLAFYENLINSGTLSTEALKQMKISAEELKIEMLALGNAIDQVPIDKINARMSANDEKIDDIQYLIDRSKAIAGLMDEGSADYNNEIQYQVELLKENQQAIMNKRNDLKQLLQTETLNIEKMKEYKEQLEDLSLEYWNLEGVIKSTELALKESNEKLVQQTADKLISAYKDYISQKRDMHIRSIESEMTAEDRRHRKVMDNYRDEMDAYQKLIQDKIDSIDREESEFDYAKEMNELEKERLEVLRKINLLSLDNSLEAKAERKDLNEELAKIDDNISTKRRKKESDDRKTNLNDMLKNKQDQINEQEKLETDKHEKEKERIEDLKEYWNQFYTDQLNDERKFAKIKEDIVAGNFEALSAEFQGFLTEMKDTMPELENTLDGTMKAVGTSIRENIIQNIQDAIDMLKEVKDNTASGTSGYAKNSYASSSTSPQTKTLSSADSQVLLGKFLTDKVRNEVSDQAQKTKIQTKAHSLAASGRTAGSTYSSTDSFDTILATLSKEQKQQLSQYLLSNGVNSVSTPSLQEFIKNYAKKIASLDTGGYTGKFQGDKLGILHEEEVILNKKETKDFFKYGSILESLQRLINPIKMAGVRQPELNSLSATPSISLEFHVDKMIANESTAKNLAQTVLSEVQNTLKRERGIR